MAQSLVQAAKLHPDIIKAGVMEKFAEQSDILQRMPIETIMGNSIKFNKRATTGAVAWRAVNGSYTESVGTFDQVTESLYILGGDADVDRFLQLMLSDQTDQRQAVITGKVQAMSHEFDRVFIDGDTATNANEPNGLNIRTAGAQTLYAGTNGGALTTALLDQLIDLIAGEPTMLVTFKGLRRALRALFTASTHYLEYGLDAFGKRITSYAGTPILVVDENMYPTAILGFDETRGSSSITGSIYAVKTGDGYFKAIQGAGGIEIMDLGMLQSNPAERTRIEWFLGFMQEHTRSVARLAGVLA